ncbi:type II toxin-antitoxin system HicA family toxin [candidate division WOR-3 bacterium]|nr:type II toxin-antitoxin system HicA family toxin [candidate division WOR-3 bacterium]
MSKLKKLSGKKLIKILCNKLGFKSVRQKGSHVLLIKYSPEKIGCIVPLHKELKIGTLKSILRQAKISEEQIKKYL